MLSPQTKTLKVLLLDPIPEQARDVLLNAGYGIDDCYNELSEGALARKLTEYHVACVAKEREDEYLTDEVLRSAHRLLAIGCFTTSASQINVSVAQHMGIPVITAPYQHQHCIAEYIMSSIVLLSRQLLDRSVEVHSQTWNKVSAGCYEVRGKTLGIIGYGGLGGQVGVLAEALSLRVIFYDQDSVMPIGSARSVASIKELLENSNYVVVAVNAAEENVRMIGKEELSWMPKGSYLINTSYSEAVDLEALSEALKSGQLNGAALDSFPNQPKAAKATFQTPLEGCKNVILTPSISDSTVQSTLRTGLEVANAIVKYIRDGTTSAALNFPSIVAWPIKPGQCRILNMHRNVRGVLREIDSVLSEYNVQRQLLDTQGGLGYFIADVDAESVATEIVSQLALLSHTIRMRIL
ncbi:phosphoglycerate dehydrogenase [Synchytrium endobioticum]|nr:phosphoglycerate dehydrogenase [Synchytrium endobioticum]